MRYCSVPHCATYGNTPGISFHKYPSDEELRRVWLKTLRIDRAPHSFEYLTVCSKHFVPEDYQTLRLGSKRRVLKLTAVPTQNLPGTPAETWINGEEADARCPESPPKRTRLLLAEPKVPNVVLADDADQNIFPRMESENGSSCSPKEFTMNSEDQLRYRGKRRSLTQCANLSETKRAKSAKEEQKRDRFCWICHREPASLTCHTCPRSFHPSCVNLKVKTLSEWVCPECVRVMAAENLDTRPPGLAQLGVDEFCSLLQFALQRLKQHTHEAFLRPVCTKTYPNYTDYVSHPFDLSILEKNVRWRHYGCTESFISDARWIYHNCIVFNGYNHRLSMSAKVLMKVCKQEMEEIEVCPDCYRNANTHESWFTEPCRRPHLLVWAKLKGFPYWPAKAMRVRDGNVDARFFGAHDRAWVPLSQCYHLSKEYPTDSKNKKKGLQNAMEELEIYIQKYREKFREFSYRSPKEPVTQADVENAQVPEVAVPVEGKNLRTSTPIKNPSNNPKNRGTSFNGRGSTSPKEEVKAAPAALEKSDPASSPDDDLDSKPLAALRRKVRINEEKSICPAPDAGEKIEFTAVREEAHREEPKEPPCIERSSDPANPDNGTPKGIFEVSSELPGELKIRVSKEDMVDLPKKVNRSMEDLVSTLRKIQRSISTDGKQGENPDTSAEEEEERKDAEPASLEGGTAIAVEKEADAVEEVKEVDESGPPPTEDGAAPADDFKEKLKKTILTCKEKIGEVKEVDLEGEDVEEEEEEEEEKMESEEDPKEETKGTARSKDESLTENGTSADSWDSGGRPPRRAKMKFTSRRSSTERMLANGSLELSNSTASDPLDDKPLSMLRQFGALEDTAETCKEEMAELHHNFALALKEMRICWGLELKRALAAVEERTSAEVNKAVAETKKKQWCANCWKEAVFYCCWNTSYCDYPCQQAHWPKHMSSCTQAAAQVQAATVVNNNPLTELSLAGDKSAILLPNNFQAAPASAQLTASKAQSSQASLLRTTLSANPVQLGGKAVPSFTAALPPGLSVTPLHQSNA